MRLTLFQTVLAAAVLALSAASLPAQVAIAQVPAGMELGPQVGAMAPGFSLLGTHGHAQTLDTLKGTQGVVLVFVRSADWCPFCKQQLKDMEKVAGQLGAMGWPVASVSYDPVETLQKFATASKLSYPLLSDAGSKAIDAFGIRNEGVKGSARFNGIPHPIILFIGADGRVKAKLYEQRYQDRPPGELIVETAKGLMQAS